MRTLLWKDFRLSQAILPAGLSLTAAPYLLALLSSGYMRLDAAWQLSAFLSQFTLALLAGDIIASERADRSAEFLAFQGASRAKVITSKAILCLLAFVAINAMMVLTREAILLTPEHYLARPPRWYIWSFQFGAAATGLAFWGCCWLLSSFLDRPVIAIMFGALAPALVAAILNRFDWEGLPGSTYWYCYGTACGAIGAAAFAAGTWYYVRRREP
jgi:hypothetical protein